jgi:hypothetical protein
MADLRNEMPKTAALIDSLRISFGKDVVDQVLRDAMAGKPVFFSEENGKTFGVRSTKVKSLISWDAKGRSFAVDIPAGVSIEQEAEMIRNAAALANTRVFDRKGREVQAASNSK